MASLSATVSFPSAAIPVPDVPPETDQVTYLLLSPRLEPVTAAVKVAVPPGIIIASPPLTVTPVIYGPGSRTATLRYPRTPPVSAKTTSAAAVSATGTESTPELFIVEAGASPSPVNTDQRTAPPGEVFPLERVIVAVKGWVLPFSTPAAELTSTLTTS
jgi:hypothetical protein